MKRIIVIVLVAALYLYLGGGDNQQADARYSVAGTSYSAEKDGDIVMYSTAWCGVCQMTRELFDEENIRYIEYDIEKSEEYYRQFSELGGQGVPLVKIGRNVIHGYNRDLILASIGPR